MPTARARIVNRDRFEECIRYIAFCKIRHRRRTANNSEIQRTSAPAPSNNDHDPLSVYLFVAAIWIAILTGAALLSTFSGNAHWQRHSVASNPRP